MTKDTHHLRNRPAFFTTPGNSRMKVGITCSKCGAQEIGSDRPGLPPELISKHFAASGWKAALPTIGEKFSSALTAIAERITPAIVPDLKPIMTSSNPSQNAIRAQAIMHRLLGERFSAVGDTGVGAYDEGWSDARISNEAGLALAEIVKVREAAYGKIVDPRFAKLEAAINAAAAKLARDTAELATMLETVKAEGAKTIADLQRQRQEPLVISEAKRRADDARNGCAQKPKPPGDPRALVLAALPATREQIRERTGLSNADTKAAISSLMRDGSILSVRGVWTRRP